MPFEEGSGNVFADLDLPHPEEELLKARLTLQIYRLIKGRGLTQVQAGESSASGSRTSRRSCATGPARFRSSASSSS
jgi:predicted XRE-type DNA-binding protein